MNKNQKKMNNKGFSIVELIIVIAIMAALVGVLAPTYLGYVEKSKKSTDVQNAQQLATSIGVYAAENTLATTADWTKVTDTVTGGVALPSQKLTSTNLWFYQYNGKTVKIGTGTESGTKVELYPTVDSSYQ